MPDPHAIYGRLADALESDWRAVARPNQLPPEGDWFGWLILAGRGWGKTRTGAEWVRAMVETGQARRIALVAATAADAREVMIEGESGILAISPSWNRPDYEPSKRRVTWPNGAIATAYSAEESERLRGPQHDAAWCDELGAWRNRDATWDQLMFGLRLGVRPRMIVTTTPRPIKLIKDLMVRSDFVVTRGGTSDNAANLARSFLETIVSRYAGTRLGRQELEAEVLEDVEGALWSRDQIEDCRRAKEDLPAMQRIVVAIDPAVSSSENSDETGIVVAGLGQDGHGYVMEDASGKYSPTEWARKAVGLYHKHRADRVVAEINQGGQMVESTLRVVDPNVAYRAVHATRGKIVRAEPISALYEQFRVHHVGVFPELEDQLCTFSAGSPGSPDRLDALVWALTDLMVGVADGTAIIEWMRQQVELSGNTEGGVQRAAPDMVLMRAPPGPSSVGLMSGRMIAIGEDRIVEMTAEDAKPMKAIGWIEVEKKNTIAGPERGT